MTKLKAILLVLLASCGDNSLSSIDACNEQAETWCALAEPAHGYEFDCVAAYRSDCAPRILRVTPDAQDACLLAIDAHRNQHTGLVHCVPRECIAIWRNETLTHFLTC